MSAEERRVVITGMGLVSPLGHSLDSLWNAISQRQSGVGLLTRVAAQPLPSDCGGEAHGFEGKIDDFGELEKMTKRAVKKGLRLMCREIQMGVAASQTALNHAGLTEAGLDPARIGTMFGSDYIITEPHEFSTGILTCLDDERNFEFERWGQEGKPKVEPTWLLKYLPNMPASHVAIYNDFRGPSNSITVREASSNLAVAEATTTIRRGIADVMIAGATGSRIQTLRTIHTALQERLADRHAEPAGGDPSKACRPFDKDRTGMVLGEGAGVIVLESLESAEARGATIYGEVIGYGSSAVADSNGVGNIKTALTNAIRATLRTSGLEPAEIGHVHGHGLGDPEMDRAEAAALAGLFGTECPVTATKSFMGNLGAGSGMVELIASLTGIRKGQVIPTLNHDTPDPECPIQVVSDAAQPASPAFLNVNVTPQGQASAVAVRAEVA